MADGDFDATAKEKELISSLDYQAKKEERVPFSVDWDVIMTLTVQNRSSLPFIYTV